MGAGGGEGRAEARPWAESAGQKGTEAEAEDLMSEGGAGVGREGLLEIIQLDNGDVVLRRTQAPDAEPLVAFRFSRALLERFGDDLLEVVEAMLDAAADAASDLHEQHSGENRNGWALMFQDEGSTLH
jgi:hypothetical protein